MKRSTLKMASCNPNKQRELGTEIHVQVFQSRREAHKYDILKSSCSALLCWSALRRRITLFSTSMSALLCSTSAEKQNKTFVQARKGVPLAINIGQKCGLIWKIKDHPIRYYTDDNGSQSFEYKDPRPTSFAPNTVHLSYRSCQQTAKGSRDSGG